MKARPATPASSTAHSNHGRSAARWRCDSGRASDGLDFAPFAERRAAEAAAFVVERRHQRSDGQGGSAAAFSAPASSAYGALALGGEHQAGERRLHHQPRLCRRRARPRAHRARHAGNARWHARASGGEVLTVAAALEAVEHAGGRRRATARRALLRPCQRTGRDARARAPGAGRAAPAAARRRGRSAGRAGGIVGAGLAGRLGTGGEDQFGRRIEHHAGAADAAMTLAPTTTGAAAASAHTRRTKRPGMRPAARRWVASTGPAAGVQRQQLAGAAGAPLAQVVAGFEAKGRAELGRPRPLQSQRLRRRVRRAGARRGRTANPRTACARVSPTAAPGRRLTLMRSPSHRDFQRRGPDAVGAPAWAGRGYSTASRACSVLCGFGRARRQHRERHALAARIDDAQVLQPGAQAAGVGAGGQRQLHEGGRHCRRSIGA